MLKQILPTMFISLIRKKDNFIIQGYNENDALEAALFCTLQEQLQKISITSTISRRQLLEENQTFRRHLENESFLNIGKHIGEDISLYNSTTEETYTGLEVTKEVLILKIGGK